MGLHLGVSMTSFTLSSRNNVRVRSSNKMPAAVRAAIAESLRLYGDKSEGDAKEYVAGMEREGRLVEDCWA